MACSYTSELEGNFIFDESIIREYCGYKMNQDIQQIIKECLKSVGEVEGRDDDSYGHTELYNLKEIMELYNKNKHLTDKQKKAACYFLTMEAFWILGPIKMEEIIVNQYK